MESRIFKLYLGFSLTIVSPITGIRYSFDKDVNDGVCKVSDQDDYNYFNSQWGYKIMEVDELGNSVEELTELRKPKSFTTLYSTEDDVSKNPTAEVTQLNITEEGIFINGQKVDTNPVKPQNKIKQRVTKVKNKESELIKKSKKIREVIEEAVHTL